MRWLVFAAVLVVWQFAVRAVSSGRQMDFPPPSAIAQRMAQLWFSGPADHLFLTPEATGNILPSVARLLTGWGLAAVAGVSVGLVLGRWPAALDVVDPVIQFSRAIPPPTLVPLFIVLFKLGTTMHVAVIAFGVVWPVLLNTIEGARSVDPVQLDTARSFHLTAAQRLGWVVLPATAPKIFAGLRISLSLAVILMVISEMVGSTNGIGFSLISAQQNFQVTDVWAAIVLLGILGYLLNTALLWTEHRVLAWHQGTRGLD